MRLRGRSGRLLGGLVAAAALVGSIGLAEAGVVAPLQVAGAWQGTLRCDVYVGDTSTTVTHNVGAFIAQFGPIEFTMAMGRLDDGVGITDLTLPGQLSLLSLADLGIADLTTPVGLLQGAEVVATNATRAGAALCTPPFQVNQAPGSGHLLASQLFGRLGNGPLLTGRLDVGTSNADGGPLPNASAICLFDLFRQGPSLPVFCGGGPF